MTSAPESGFRSEDDERWEAVDPHRAARWFEASARPWWIGGGWAIDLFLDATTRPHHDLDVGIFRDDERETRSLFPGWEFASAHAGRLDPLPREKACPIESHSIWCRPQGADAWLLELVLEEMEGAEWVFRRDSLVRRPVDSMWLHSKSGLPILAPEIELLYKSKSIRPKDRHDFEAIVPRLSAEARDWLREALSVVSPGHPWIEELK